MLADPRMPPAVVVHGTIDIDRACAAGVPMTLVSAPGTGVFAGPGWWLALIRDGCARHPGLIAADILDCADAPGIALAALRLGQMSLILDRACPGFAAVAATAATLGARVLADRPPALDLAPTGAERHLGDWLARRDSAPPLR